MIRESLQSRIRSGEEEAFRQLYAEYSGEIYRSAKTALKDETAARQAVKTVMVSLYRAMCEAGTAIDTDAKVEELTRSALATPSKAPRHLTAPAAEGVTAGGAPRYVGGSASAKRVSPGAVVGWVFFGLFLAFLLWLFAGILMALSVLPKLDLGYTFFDTRIFPLFLLNK